MRWKSPTGKLDTLFGGYVTTNGKIGTAEQDEDGEVDV